MAATSAGLLGGVPTAAGDDEPTESRDPETALLSLDDLATPEGETYVRWETPDAPLLAAFRRTVPGFGATPTAGRSFLATPGEAAPAVVETGAVALAKIDVESLVRATARWVSRRAPDASVDVEARRSSTAVQWRTDDADGLDVVHLHRAGGFLLITVASGPRDATLRPDEAVARYARTMRRKARDR